MTTSVVGGRRWGGALLALAMVAAVPLLFGNTASAGVELTVPLGRAGNYTVLGATTVTNTATATVLDCCLGLYPGTSITGFPPGTVNPPGTIDLTNVAAQGGQTDLTTAYLDAESRIGATLTGADLAGATLQPGLYATTLKGALALSGTLTLDGANDPTSVFIFQTDSSLTTATSSEVHLINSAQECNVFWQVGSDATLGTNSIFAGNLLADNAITVTSGAVVHGRALARNAAVTLDANRFFAPTCAQAPVTTTTDAPTTTTGAATTTTTGATTTTTTTSLPATTTTTAALAATTTTTSAAPDGNTALAGSGAATTTTSTAGGGTATTVAAGGGTATTIAAGGGTATTIGLPGTPVALTGGPAVPGVVGAPRTGAAALRHGHSAAAPWRRVLATFLLGGGAVAAIVRRRGAPITER